MSQRSLILCRCGSFELFLGLLPNVMDMEGREDVLVTIQMETELNISWLVG